MPGIFACIAGEEVYRPWDERRIPGQRIEPRQTPFGPSGEIFLVDSAATPFYLLPRYGAGPGHALSRAVNYRANLYALKDMGVQYILGWGPGGAITHNYAVGDLVILSDLVDHTYLRPKTYFENSPLGFLRQFPVFCPEVGGATEEALERLGHPYSDHGVYVCTQGPRLETPAEIHYFRELGGDLVGMTLAPEVFLARELEMCYSPICYITNYAEGVRPRELEPGELFEGLLGQAERAAVDESVRRFLDIATAVARLLPLDRTCQCGRSMERYRREGRVGEDWHTWLGEP